MVKRTWSLTGFSPATTANCVRLGQTGCATAGHCNHIESRWWWRSTFSPASPICNNGGLCMYAYVSAVKFISTLPLLGQCTQWSFQPYVVKGRPTWLPMACDQALRQHRQAHRQTRESTSICLCVYVCVRSDKTGVLSNRRMSVRLIKGICQTTFYTMHGFLIWEREEGICSVNSPGIPWPINQRQSCVNSSGWVKGVCEGSFKLTVVKKTTLPCLSSMKFLSAPVLFIQEHRAKTYDE